MQQAQVIIIGAGPAGAACAWKLKQAGVDFLLLDRAIFPRPKPCAGWVTPQVWRDLEVDPADYPHSLTHFARFEVWVKRLHFGLRTNQYAIRRIEFDTWLLQRAGLEPLHHAAHSIALRGGQYEVDGEFSAPWLVGAGGTRCPVRQAFFPAAQTGALIAAMEEEFPYPDADPRCHLWFFQDSLPGYAWYVPKAGGFVNVGIGGAAQTLKKDHDSLRRHWEGLTAKLEREGLVRGHPYAPAGHAYYLRARKLTPRAGNALLAGDSLGLATLDMGEGIGPAVRSGILAAKAILGGEEYSTASITRYSFPSLIGMRK